MAKDTPQGNRKGLDNRVADEQKPAAPPPIDAREHVGFQRKKRDKQARKKSRAPEVAKEGESEGLKSIPTAFFWLPEGKRKDRRGEEDRNRQSRRGLSCKRGAGADGRSLISWVASTAAKKKGSSQVRGEGEMSRAKKEKKKNHARLVTCFKNGPGRPAAYGEAGAYLVGEQPKVLTCTEKTSEEPGVQKKRSDTRSERANSAALSQDSTQVMSRGKAL